MRWFAPFRAGFFLSAVRDRSGFREPHRVVYERSYQRQLGIVRFAKDQLEQSRRVAVAQEAANNLGLGPEQFGRCGWHARQSMGEGFRFLVGVAIVIVDRVGPCGAMCCGQRMYDCGDDRRFSCVSLIFPTP